MKKSQKNDTHFNREDLLKEWAEEADALEAYEHHIKLDKGINRKKIAVIVMCVIMSVLMILSLFFPMLVWLVQPFILFMLFESLDMRIDQLWALRMVDNILDEHQLKQVKELLNGKLNNK